MKTPDEEAAELLGASYETLDEPNRQAVKDRLNAEHDYEVKP